MANLYVVNSQKPTAVSHSISCNFSGKGERDLVLAKGNILEFYSFSNDKLELLLEAPVFGEILSLLSLPSQKNFLHDDKKKKEYIFVLLAKKFCLLEYDENLNIVKTRSLGSLKDIETKELESGYLAMIDPSASLLCVKLCAGVLKFIPYENDNLYEPFSLSYPDSIILDIKFLHTSSSHPVLAILSESLNKTRSFRTYEINLEKKSLVSYPLSSNAKDLSLTVERSSCMIIPVQIGGALIIGLSSISYIYGSHGSSPKIISIEITPTTINSYTLVHKSSTTFLLSDYRGRLILLQLQTELFKREPRVKNIILKMIGVTSIAENLSYLTNGYLFVGSVYGDSQLVKIIKTSTDFNSTSVDNDDLDEEENYTKKKKFKNDDYHSNLSSFSFPSPQSSSQISLQIIEEFPNLGPIFDMCLTQEERGGTDYNDMRKQLVTCSGAYKEGSLKILRSGVGIEESVSVSVENLKNIWTLKDPNSSNHKYLVQSYLNNTKILQYIIYNNSTDGELVELNLEKKTFEFNESTLFCSEVLSFYLQVTPSKIIIVNKNSLDQVFLWNNSNKSDNNLMPSERKLNENLVNQFIQSTSKIINVKLLNNYLITSLTFGWLVIFKINTDSSISISSINKYDNDIACFSAYTYTTNKKNEDKNDDTLMDLVEEENSQDITYSLLSISFWGEKSLKIFDFFSLELLNSIQLGSEIQARDLLIVSFPSKNSKKMNSNSNFIAKNNSNSQSDNNLYIFVGLGDGFLLSYVIDFNPFSSTSLFDFTQRKKTLLGTKPISFRVFEDFNGEFCVFALCDNPTIIVERYKKLNFSELDYLKGKVRCITPFHTLEDNKNGVILGTEDSLVLGSIEGIAKLHLQKISLPLIGQEFCNKIIYLSEINVYALLSTRINPKKLADGEGSSICRLILLNGKDFQLLDSYEFDAFESPLSITSINLSSSPSNSSFIVGTGYVSPSNRESKQGRLLFFSVSNTKTLWLLGERKIGGAVISICTIQTPNKIVACVGSNVNIYSIERINKDNTEESTSSVLYNHIDFIAECYHSGYVLAITAKSNGNHILIGDLIRSIVHLKYDEENKLLIEISRDYNTHYLRAIEIMGKINESNYSKLISSSNTPTATTSDQMDISPSSSSSLINSTISNTLKDPIFLAFDDSSNLMSFKEGTLNPNEVNKIWLNSEYHNGSLPNVIIKGSLVNNNYIENDHENFSSSDKDLENYYNIYHPDYQSVTGYNLQDANTQCIYGTVTGSMGNIIALSDVSYSFFLAVESSLKLLLSLSTTFSITKVNPLMSNEKLYNLLSSSKKTRGESKEEDEEEDLLYLATDNDWLLALPNYLGLGDFLHEEWRSFSTASRYHKSTKIIDGDLIEAALTLPQPALSLLTRLINEELSFKKVYKTYFNTDSYLKIHNKAPSASHIQKEDEYYNRVSFTPYEIIRRIEDINRTH